MATRVKIGKKEYEVPELNFAGLERAWPFIDAAMMTLHPMAGPSAGISIIAAGLMEADHFKATDFGIGEHETLGEEQTFERVTKFLKKQLKATQIEQIRLAVENITKEAGLDEAEEGEALKPPTGEANLSTETAVTSSPSSLQPGAVGETTTLSENDIVSPSITN
jgi:hypothetical protein